MKGIIIPAYFDVRLATGRSDWQQMIDAAPKLGDRLIIIATGDNSGPGPVYRQDLYDAIDDAKSAGARVIGYVHTCWFGRWDGWNTNTSVFSNGCDVAHGTHPGINLSGYRPGLRQWLQGQVNDWYRFYPNIAGIFLDEGSPDPTDLGFYKDLFDDIVAARPQPHPLVVYNPGLPLDPSYFNVGTKEDSIICVYEDSGTAFFNSNPWRRRSDYSEEIMERSFLLVHGLSPANLDHALDVFRQDEFRWLYLTDQPGWSKLSSYYETLVDEVTPLVLDDFRAIDPPSPYPIQISMSNRQVERVDAITFAGNPNINRLTRLTVKPKDPLANPLPGSIDIGNGLKVVCPLKLYPSYLMLAYGRVGNTPISLDLNLSRRTYIQFDFDEIEGTNLAIHITLHKRAHYWSGRQVLVYGGAATAVLNFAQDFRDSRGMAMTSSDLKGIIRIVVRIRSGSSARGADQRYVLRRIFTW